MGVLSSGQQQRSKKERGEGKVTTKGFNKIDVSCGKFGRVGGRKVVKVKAKVKLLFLSRGACAKVKKSLKNAREGKRVEIFDGVNSEGQRGNRVGGGEKKKKKKKKKKSSKLEGLGACQRIPSVEGEGESLPLTSLGPSEQDAIKKKHEKNEWIERC